MINIRLVVPPRLTRAVSGHLAELDTVTHVVVLPGAALSPAGDAVSFDATRELPGTSRSRSPCGSRPRSAGRCSSSA